MHQRGAESRRQAGFCVSSAPGGARQQPWYRRPPPDDQRRAEPRLRLRGPGNMSPKTLPLGPVMLDVVGMELTGDDRRRLTHPLTGGVILFSRNFSGLEQLAR